MFLCSIYTGIIIPVSKKKTTYICILYFIKTVGYQKFMTLPITATFMIHVVEEVINVGNVDLGSFFYFLNLIYFSRLFFIACILCCCENLCLCCNVIET